MKIAWVTEKLRNFHFRTMLKLSPLVMSGQEDEYVKQRAKAFDFFCRTEFRNLPGQLVKIVSSDEYRPEG